MFSRKSIFSAAIAAMLAASAAPASAADCRIPSQRDATCVGSIRSEGAKTNDNREINGVSRGTNIKTIKMPEEGPQATPQPKP